MEHFFNAESTSQNANGDTSQNANGEAREMNHVSDSQEENANEASHEQGIDGSTSAAILTDVPYSFAFDFPPDFVKAPPQMIVEPQTVLDKWIRTKITDPEVTNPRVEILPDVLFQYMNDVQKFAFESAIELMQHRHEAAEHVRKIEQACNGARVLKDFKVVGPKVATFRAPDELDDDCRELQQFAQEEINDIIKDAQKKAVNSLLKFRKRHLERLDNDCDQVMNRVTKFGLDHWLRISGYTAAARVNQYDATFQVMVIGKDGNGRMNHMFVPPSTYFFQLAVGNAMRQAAGEWAKRTSRRIAEALELSDARLMANAADRLAVDALPPRAESILMKAVEEKAQETAIHEVDKMLSSSLIQSMAKDIQEMRETLNKEAAPHVEQGAARDGDQCSTQGKKKRKKENGSPNTRHTI